MEYCVDVFFRLFYLFSSLIFHDLLVLCLCSSILSPLVFCMAWHNGSSIEENLMNIFGLMSRSLIYGRVTTTPLPVDLFALCSTWIEIQWNLLNFVSVCLCVRNSSLLCEAAYLLELTCFTLLCLYILWEVI